MHCLPAAVFLLPALLLGFYCSDNIDGLHFCSFSLCRPLIVYCLTSADFSLSDKNQCPLFLLFQPLLVADSILPALFVGFSFSDKNQCPLFLLFHPLSDTESLLSALSVCFLLFYLCCSCFVTHWFAAWLVYRPPVDLPTMLVTTYFFFLNFGIYSSQLVLPTTKKNGIHSDFSFHKKFPFGFTEFENHRKPSLLLRSFIM